MRRFSGLIMSLWAMPVLVKIRNALDEAQGDLSENSSSGGRWVTSSLVVLCSLARLRIRLRPFIDRQVSSASCRPSPLSSMLSPSYFQCENAMLLVRLGGAPSEQRRDHVLSENLWQL
ncbi:hypothetical protein BC827DRAFT_1213606 [Russula dissimulans]|nr:hypothetical protein BC827DRAFT_1213606 [Russula dissimulans]